MEMELRKPELSFDDEIKLIALLGASEEVLEELREMKREMEDNGNI